MIHSTDQSNFLITYLFFLFARSRNIVEFTLYNSYFLPARRYASAGNSDRNVFVRLSVTCRYCVKTKKASGMISSTSGSLKTLVF